MNKKYRNALIKMDVVPTKQNLDKLTVKERYKLNEIVQKEYGKEEFDYLTLNEPGSDTNSAFEYKSLKEWDFEDWKFQKEHKTIVPESYDYLYMPGIWFRALEINDFGKRRLTYGQLESARSFCFLKVLEKLDKKLDKEIPFLYSREYGVGMFSKIENSEYSSLNIGQKRCGGREKEREILEKKLKKYHEQIEKDVLELLKPYDGYTFRKVSDQPIYDHLDYFIFGGFNAAENTGFKSFFTDFYSMQQPVELLDIIIKSIYKKYKIKIFNSMS
jgi:hypothetical protein